MLYLHTCSQISLGIRFIRLDRPLCCVTKGIRSTKTTLMSFETDLCKVIGIVVIYLALHLLMNLQELVRAISRQPSHSKALRELHRNGVNGF